MGPLQKRAWSDHETIAVPSGSGSNGKPTPPPEDENERTLEDPPSRPRPEPRALGDASVTFCGSPPPVVSSSQNDADVMTVADPRYVAPAAHPTPLFDDGGTVAIPRPVAFEPNQTHAADDGMTVDVRRDDAVAVDRTMAHETGGSGSDCREAPPPDTLLGVTVPGYDLLVELGRGGMGVVYKARDRRLNRMVALKMILGGAHAGEIGLERFRTEAEAVAKLHHPNIVQIYETGEHDGHPYFSLEFVEGGSLESQMRESPTTPQAAAEVVETLARAMEFAHQHGIVHRDLKPANVLLGTKRVGSSGSSRKKESGAGSLAGREKESSSSSTASRSKETRSGSLSGRGNETRSGSLFGRGKESGSSAPSARKKEGGTGSGSSDWVRTTVPKIADFGLAKQVDGDSSNTQSGTILGTPCYMAPEQARGESSKVGPPADIYALGSVLYEMLVGRPPFRSTNPIDTIRQVIDQEPVPPRQLEPRVPLDLETICLKCLEKDPARRFATSGDLADDLRRFVDGHPIHSRPIRAWERAWKWGKRRPAIVALMGLGVLTVVGMVLFIAWHNVDLRSRLDQALADERVLREREQADLLELRLSQLREEAQKLFDSARLAVSVRDWPQARVQLAKALTTIGDVPSLGSLKGSAQGLLEQVERELSLEADREASQARFQEFARLRNEAQFLGTLYTGMDLALNLEAARSAVQRALGVYGVSIESKTSPRLDDELSTSQKAEVRADCYELLLILAETEARSASEGVPSEKDSSLRRALDCLEQARSFGTPSRAFYLRRARYLGMLGHQAEALQAESEAGKASLDSDLDHFLMADELYRREHFGEAIQEFDRVLQRSPGHFWAQYLDALCLLREKRPAEARALLSACLAQRTDFVWLYLLRGFAQEELQAWDAAEADFEKAAQLPLDENTRYVLLVYRGVLRIRTDHCDDAIADLQAAVELKPKAYQAFVNMANAHRRLGRLDEAVAQLNLALQREPGLAQLYRMRARLELERKEPDLALADFNEAIAREAPNSPYQVDDLVDQGRLFLRGSKDAEALASFDAALALSKDHPQAQRLRADALFHLGRFEEVVAAFDRYLETGKPLESVYRGRGLARAELGHYPGAIEDFTKALELSPTSAVQAYRGWLHLTVDAPKLALRDFELAIELDPRNGDAYNGRGMAQATQGRFREAMQDAAQAIRLGPPSPRLLYNAARAHALCPNPGPQRAIELIRQALSMHPSEERHAFWSKNIQRDPALASLRNRPAFADMETALKRGK